VIFDQACYVLLVLFIFGNISAAFKLVFGMPLVF